MVCASPYYFWSFRDTSKETIALCGTRYVIIDIQALSFTRVNSRHLQFQCLAKAAFCKSSTKGQVLLVLLETVGRSPKN